MSRAVDYPTEAPMILQRRERSDSRMPGLIFQDLSETEAYSR